VWPWESATLSGSAEHYQWTVFRIFFQFNRVHSSAHLEQVPVGDSNGAARGIRTPDPVITNDVLYQLSYCGFWPPLR
jgi:hypothetical protein